jgi:arginine/serine-rich splicing factor 7
MSRFSSRNSAGTGCKVYIGGLTQNASKDEIEEAFERYGRLRSVFVARNPPGFAFVEFGDPYDAEDSVKALDGRLICGSRVKVEISHGRSRPKNFGEIDSYRRDRDPRDRRMDDRDYRRDYQRPGRSDSHRRSRYLMHTFYLTEDSLRNTTC